MSPSPRRRLGVTATGLLAACALTLPASGTGTESEPAHPQMPPLAETPAGRELEQRAKQIAAGTGRSRAARATAPARMDRLASRGRYAGLNRAGAVALARERYGRDVVAPAHRPLKDRAVERIVDQQHAIVTVGGERRMTFATTPLAVPDGDGDLEPMDLALEETGDGFVPRAAKGRLRLPRSVGGAIQIGGLRLHLEHGGEGATGEIVGGGVMYANAGTDADTVVRPRPTGLEVFDVLRSANSPEQLAFRLSGADGVRLRPTPGGDGSFEILDGDTVVGAIGRLMAVDADGEPVSVDAAADGSTLRVRVPHRSGDHKYPIVVDPALEWYPWQQTGTGMYSNWSWEQAGSDNNRWPHYWGNHAYLGNGLYVHKNCCWNHWYWHAEAAYFRFWPIGTTRIVRAGGAYMDQDLLPGDRDRTCMFIGTMRTYAWTWQGQWMTCHDEDFSRNWYYSVPSHETGPNSLLFGTYMNGDGDRGQFADNVGHVELDIDDPERPSISSPTTSAWKKTGDVQASASDPGLGMRQVKLNGVERWSRQCYNVTQGGGTCPRDTGTISATFGEGQHQLTWRAHDPLTLGDDNRAGTHTQTLRVDATRPTVSLAANSVVGRNVLGDGEYELRVNGVDPHPNGAVNSGVRQVRIYVDGVHRHTATQGLQNTDLPVLWHWDTSLSGLGEGNHTVRVEATDGALNEAVPITFAVTVDLSRARVETPPATADAGEGSMGDGGHPSCTQDPETGNAYCGEGDGDPEFDAVDSERSAGSFSPLALEATLLPLLAKERAMINEQAQQQSSGQPVGFGLSDQNEVRKVNPWEDSRFHALRMTHARLIVPWNLVTRAVAASNLQSVPQQYRGDPVQCGKPACNDLAYADRWMRAVRRMPGSEPKGGRVLLSIGARLAHPTAGNRNDPNRTPSVDEYAEAVRQIRRRYARLNRQQPDTYPQVRLFTAWNEPNVRGFAPDYLAAHPERAAQFHRELARQCGDGGQTDDDVSCRVIAGDFTDSPDVIGSPGQDGQFGTGDDVAGYFQRYKDALRGYRPRQWAIHGYGCARDNKVDLLREYARGTRNNRGTASPDDPDLWITEAGGMYHLLRDGRSEQDAENEQANQMRNLLGTCLNASARYTRLYVYQWAGDMTRDINGDGRLTNDDKDGDGDVDFGDIERRWDSGLTRIGSDLQANNAAARYRRRPAYCVLYENRNPNSACPAE